MAAGIKVDRWIPWLMWFLVQLPALQPVTKYAPMAVITVPLYFLATAGVTWLVCKNWHTPRMQKIMGTGWPTLSFFLLLTVAIFFIYPIADALKELPNRGRDSDNAVIDAAVSFWQGAYMYDVETYLSNPISPGPGWILLLSPLVVIGAYWMITPLMLGIFLVVLRRVTGNWQASNIVSLLLASSLHWWSETVTGADIPGVGLALATCALLTYASRSPRQVIAVAVLLGVVVTSRAPLFFVPVLFALLLWPRDKRLAVTFAFIGVSICVGFHLLFAGMSPNPYPPFHVMTKAEKALPFGFAAIMLVSVIAAGLYILRTALRAPSLALLDSMRLCWLGLFAPFIFVSVGGLLYTAHGDMTNWDGAGHLNFAMILGLTFLALALARCGESPEPRPSRH